MNTKKHFNIFNLSNEVTKYDGSNNGIWYFGERINIENELIIGFSPTNYHSFIICGNKEFHPRFSINPCKIQESRKDNIRAAFFIRFKNIPKDKIQKMQEYMISKKGTRTPTCHQGLFQALEDGSGLKILNQDINSTSPFTFIKNILNRGVVDENQNRIYFDIYITKNKSLKRILFDIFILSLRYAPAFIASNIHYKILCLTHPKILMRQIRLSQ